MTTEDVYNTLCVQGLIDVLAIPTPKPLPGQSIKLMKNRKTIVARRHLIRSQTTDDEISKGPFVPPTQYEIHWDPGYVKSYLEKWEAKGYMKIKPEKLKWSPFLLARVKKSNADSGLALEAELMGSTPDKDNTGPASASSVPETPAPITPVDVEDSDDEVDSTPASHSPEKRMHSRERPTLRRLRSQHRTANDGMNSRSPFTPSRYLRGPGVSGSPPNTIPTPSCATSASISPLRPPRMPKLRERGNPSPSKNADTSSVNEDQLPTSARDAVDAARLAEEESRPKRLLRSRSGTGALPTFELPLLPSRSAMARPPPRKRRRVESPPVDEFPPTPEPLRESGLINGVARRDEDARSELDDTDTPLTVVTSRHSAPSDDTVVVSSGADQSVTKGVKNDTTSPVPVATDPLVMDVDEPLVSVTAVVSEDLGPDGDADADGETDADAEGEDDDELDAEGEPDDEL
jgi:hypothetical protein